MHLGVGRSENWLPHSDMKAGVPPAGHLKEFCEICPKKKGLGVPSGAGEGRSGTGEQGRGGGLR